MDTVRQYWLVRGNSGLVFFVDEYELRNFRHDHLTILSGALTKEEAQALFKISNNYQRGESK